MPCCKQFTQAVDHGSESGEKNLPIKELFGDYWLDGKIELPFIKFCPWCGVKIGSVYWHAADVTKEKTE